MSPFATRTAIDYDTSAPEQFTVSEPVVPAQPEPSFRISAEWLLAGDAIFTLQVPADYAARLGCPDHYTFRVQRVEKSDRWPTAWFVKLLTGPDNTSDYSYLGKLNDFTGQVATTAKSCQSADSVVVRLLNRVLLRAWSGDHAAYEAHGFRINHEGRCGRCGRLLTVPESVASGFGPECTKKVSR